MAVQLNHTIVVATDREASARFYSEVLGVPVAGRMGPFVVVALDNSVSLDFVSAGGRIPSQHYAFKVSDAEFSAIFARIRARGIDYWADPFHRRPGETNTEFGGRGVYFLDPDGHNLEVMTVDYELR